jgi:hypothetical protein
MFCSVIQQHLKSNFGGTFAQGKLQHLELHPQSVPKSTGESDWNIVRAHHRRYFLSIQIAIPVI